MADMVPTIGATSGIPEGSATSAPGTEFQHKKRARTRGATGVLSLRNPYRDHGRHSKPIPYMGLTASQAVGARHSFMSKVSEPEADGYMVCREWAGPKNQSGYGYVYLRGKRYAAHRMAWLLWKSEIPDGLVVCHHCDNPGCVRTEHLFLGTITDNLWDAYRKGRMRTGRHTRARRLNRLLVFAALVERAGIEVAA